MSASVALGDDVAAVLARPRADVDDVVGDPDGVLVVLDHDEGVAQVPQPDQGLDEPLVVPLVEPDRGLVEDVEHPYQPRADLGGEPDPLGLPPGQGGRRPGEGEVVEADVEQEADPGPDLLQHPLGDLRLPLGELEPVQELVGLPQRQRRHLVDAPAADGDRQGDRVEPAPAAGVAGHLPHVLLIPLPGPVRLGPLVAAGQERHHPLIGGRVLPFPPEPVGVADPDLLGPGPVQQRLTGWFGQRRPGGGEVEPELGGQPLQHPLVVLHPVAPRPGRDRPVGDRPVGVGHHQLGIDLIPGPDPRAFPTRPVGAVEAEVAGLQLVEGQPAHRAGQVLGEGEGGPFDHIDIHHPVGQVEGGLDALGEPLVDPGLRHQPVDHHLDGVLVVAVEADVLGEVPHLPVDPGPGEALGGQVLQQRLVLAFPAPHHRGQHLEPGPLLQLQHPVDDLGGGLAGHRGAVLGAVGHPDPGVEEAQVVPHLGDGAHRRAGIPRSGLLVDRDRRRQPLDEVDVGLVHLAQELAGIGRQGFDIPALALGVDGVERQRGLARPRQPGEDDQLVPGQLQREVLEVVLTGTPDEDGVRRHGTPLRQPAECRSGRGRTRVRMVRQAP
jgi:hypothetical protein